MFYNPLKASYTDDYSDDAAIDSRITQLEDEQQAWLAYIEDLDESGFYEDYMQACRAFKRWEESEGVELDELRGVVWETETL